MMEIDIIETTWHPSPDHYAYDDRNGAIYTVESRTVSSVYIFYSLYFWQKHNNPVSQLGSEY